MPDGVLKINGDSFELNGRPWRLMGGAIHYARIPRSYWRDRLTKLIDLGCNTVETYGFWNAHEPYPGHYVFDGMLDAVAFIELAGELGLKVIYRPGPYCCAEWDMGGLPWWLINVPGMALRCSNPAFQQAVQRYWTELMSRLVPLQSTRGGPIIAMQIENEYGYFGNDQTYLAWLRDLLRRLGIDVMLFTSDGAFQKLTMANGGIDGLLRTANFGSKPAERLAMLREYQPKGPLVCMEFWVGWFDEWRSGKHATRAADECAKDLDELLSLDASAVIYMFQGGTNWGFNAGGNLSETFQPFVTSYDYDALLTECGDITPKFQACREVIHRRLNLDRPAKVFPPVRKVAYGALELTQALPLHAALAALDAPVFSAVPLTMEQLGHGHGFAIYQTTLSSIYRGQSLVLRGMHDWCHVRLNGRTLATWYRRDEQPKLELEFETPEATLEIIVHNLARSNFGQRMLEPKGLTGGAFVGACRHEERALFGWHCTAMPLLSLPELAFQPIGDFRGAGDFRGPGFYRGTIEISDEPADTFLELPTFDLGCVFVNAFNVGRYWNVGPQGTLFIPAPMLRRGTNEIVVFEASGCQTPVLQLRDRAELNRSQPH